jgi:hypothetical protein
VESAGPGPSLSVRHHLAFLVLMLGRPHPTSVRKESGRSMYLCLPSVTQNTSTESGSARSTTEPRWTCYHPQESGRLPHVVKLQGTWPGLDQFLVPGVPRASYLRSRHRLRRLLSLRSKTETVQRKRPPSMVALKMASLERRLYEVPW